MPVCEEKHPSTIRTISGYISNDKNYEFHMGTPPSCCKQPTEGCINTTRSQSAHLHTSRTIISGINLVTSRSSIDRK